MNHPQLTIFIVGHHSRIEHVNALGISSLYADHIILDDFQSGAATLHQRALRHISELKHDGFSIVIEDDALPVDNFRELAGSWLKRFPTDLISFYLGTGRPPQWQSIVDKKIRYSKQHGYIVLSQLIHAVCYGMPNYMAYTILNNFDANKPADYAIGDCVSKVIYPIYSLVDHNDSLPSVERHADGIKRTERRRARFLYGK